MRQYAGLDVSLEETAVCVVDEAGRIVEETRVPSEPEALVGFFRALGLTVERIGTSAHELVTTLLDGVPSREPDAAVVAESAGAGWGGTESRHETTPSACRTSSSTGTAPDSTSATGTQATASVVPSTSTTRGSLGATSAAKIRCTPW